MQSSADVLQEIFRNADTEKLDANKEELLKLNKLDAFIQYANADDVRAFYDMIIIDRFEQYLEDQLDEVIEFFANRINERVSAIEMQKATLRKGYTP